MAGWQTRLGQLAAAGSDMTVDLPAKAFEAMLFDMDGTILDSVSAAERVWAGWALEHGLDPARFLPTIHGGRAVDTIRRLGIAGLDPKAEADRITEAEIAEVGGIAPLPGAAELLADLAADRWAVVTSAPMRLACRRLEVAGLPQPGILITAEDVERGKPDPQGFLKAAVRLGKRPADCLVFEDSDVGMEAGKAAGMHVIAITGARSAGPPADVPWVRDFRSFATVHQAGGGMRLVHRDC